MNLLGGLFFDIKKIFVSHSSILYTASTGYSTDKFKQQLSLLKGTGVHPTLSQLSVISGVYVQHESNDVYVVTTSLSTYVPCGQLQSFSVVTTDSQSTPNLSIRPISDLPSG